MSCTFWFRSLSLAGVIFVLISLMRFSKAAFRVTVAGKEAPEDSVCAGQMESEGLSEAGICNPGTICVRGLNS